MGLVSIGTDDPLREYGALRRRPFRDFASLRSRNASLVALSLRERHPFRWDFSSRLERAIVSDRCRVNHWGCQTDRITTDLSYPLAIPETTNAVSLRASLEPEGFIDREEAERSGNGTTTIKPMCSS